MRNGNNRDDGIVRMALPTLYLPGAAGWCLAIRVIVMCRGNLYSCCVVNNVKVISPMTIIVVSVTGTVAGVSHRAISSPYPRRYHVAHDHHHSALARGGAEGGNDVDDAGSVMPSHHRRCASTNLSLPSCQICC